MALDVGAREIAIRAAPAPGRVRLSVGGLARRPAREAAVEAAVGRIPGVSQVRASALTGNALVVFDPATVSTNALLDAAAAALNLVVRTEPGPNGVPGALDKYGPETSTRRRVWVVSDGGHGRVRLGVAGVRGRPELAAGVDRVLGGLPGVTSARASALTGNALVRFDPRDWTVERLLDAAAGALVDEARLVALGRAVAPPKRPPAGQPRERLASAPVAPVAPADGAALARADALPIETTPAAPAAPDLPAGRAWHAVETTEILGELGVDPDTGLDAGEVSARRAWHGVNRMPEPAETSLLKTVLDQVVNAPTALLLAGAVVSVATGGLFDAVLIGGVVVINAAVGAATERSGQRAIAALRKSTAIRARALRDGAEAAVDAEELVPGDVIQLLPGDSVPADARVLAAHRLQVEESALTGESRAVEKHEQAMPEHFSLAERRSMVHRGTTVVGGRGSAVVVATGGDTVIGALHLLAAEAEAPQTPMERDLDTIGRGLAIGATVVCAGIFGIGMLRGFGLRYGLEVAVSLGVAAIPEGLPTLATSVLAFASGRMRRKGTLIRSLGAAEALGSVTVVCADKTGTLTENRMAARELFAAGEPIQVTGAALAPTGTFRLDGTDLDPVHHRAVATSMRVGALCSDAEVEGLRDGQLALDGSATEGAILVAAVKAGTDVDALREHNPRIDLRDRSDGRRHMVTVHRTESGLVAMLKGAPDEVLTMCDRIDLADRVIPLDEEMCDRYAAHNADMAGRAMRVLALAHRRLPDPYVEQDLGRGYTLGGLIGLVDPVRPAVPAAIKSLHRAGIRTVMITGDQAQTATAVARELGLSRRGSLNVLEAGDLASLETGALRGLVRDVGIFARVAPEMKLAVVRALQANGEVAAMTGDGVNDGPALRAADVGVAMGERGSELARGLADVVLSTDDFSLMVDAVEEGRLVRANVKRVLAYLLATNASEVWAVAGAVAFGLPSPLTPLQLLWLNLVTDLAPGLALALEPRDPDLMHQPPRDPKESIIPGPMLCRLLAESAVIAAGALAVYAVGIRRYGIGPVAQTMAFASLLGSQLLHVPLARAGEKPALTGNRGRRNPWLTGAMLMSAGLQLAALFVPSLRTILGGAPLGLADLGIAVAGGVLPPMLVEASRFVFPHRDDPAAGDAAVGGTA